MITLTASAHCLNPACTGFAPEGDPAEVERLAAKHTKDLGHATGRRLSVPVMPPSEPPLPDLEAWALWVIEEREGGGAGG